MKATEADKAEIVEAVLATQKNEPYFDDELNKFFACGVHINVYKAKIIFFLLNTSLVCYVIHFYQLV